MKVIFEKTNSSFQKMKSYLDTHLRVVHVVLILGEDVKFLGPFFSTSARFRVILVQSLTSLERRLSGRSEIMHLKIESNVLIPI
jgi:hypothetical protein